MALPQVPDRLSIKLPKKPSAETTEREEAKIGKELLELADSLPFQADSCADKIRELARKLISGRSEAQSSFNVESKADQLISSLFEGKKWMQAAEDDIEKRGTEGVCSGGKFGGPTCPKGSKRYNLARTFKKAARKRADESYSDDGIESLPDPGDIDGDEGGLPQEEPYTPRTEDVNLHELIDQGNAHALSQALSNLVPQHDTALAKAAEALVYRVNQVTHFRGLIDKMDIIPGRASRKKFVSRYEQELDYNLKQAHKLADEIVSGAS